MAKGVYGCIDSVSRNVPQIPLCVDLVSRNTKAGYACVDGVSRKFFGGASLEVGDTVYIDSALFNEEFMVIHKGLPSSAYDSSCDGIWVMYKFPYENYAWTKGYSSDVYSDASTIHEYLNNTVLNKFSTNIRNLIKQVTIPCYKGDVSAKLFLLSYMEVLGTTDPYYNISEGAVLDYFNGATASDRRGWTNETKVSANAWWLRTPCGVSSSAFRIQNDGEVGTLSKTSNGAHYRFAMILPHDVQVDSNFNIIA